MDAIPTIEAESLAAFPMTPDLESFSSNGESRPHSQLHLSLLAMQQRHHAGVSAYPACSGGRHFHG
jgi:hypothetical protein